MQSLLKLSVPPEHADALWHTRALSAAVRSRLVTRRLFCAYYDTPAFKLQRHGVALRLRHQGKYWIQTIKRGGESAAGLHARFESETKVPAQRLDYPSLVSAGLGELIAHSRLRRSIGCVFCTDFVRKSALIEPAPGQRIEVSLDRGEIVFGKRRKAVCEIELELKAGDPARLFDLAMQVADELPVRLDIESKAERGYRLARAKRRQPVKAVRAPISAHFSVDEAFRSIVLGCLRHLQANERGVLESRDPEYLHQARVALRRLGSAFSVFSDAVPKTRFAAWLEASRDLGQALGEARDWDVFVSETLHSAQSGPIAPPGRSHISRRAAARRGQARRRACTALSESEYT
ncbi:MAG: CHAD domain-containing protein, partial [Burkholderiales bacterium]